MNDSESRRLYAKNYGYRFMDMAQAIRLWSHAELELARGAVTRSSELRASFDGWCARERVLPDGTAKDYHAMVAEVLGVSFLKRSIMVARGVRFRGSAPSP